MSEPAKRVLREDGLGWVAGQGLTLGKPRSFDPQAALHWNSATLRLAPSFGHWLPRGVYKFSSWEQEAEWMRTHQGKSR
ncbi:MAG: hypothetical protein NTY53_10625 [Kiritimatiellaeota bacterium]|nr:hypothetical protein [Kiritimatiellota bacterium]